jgi:hypothetical protein
VSVRLRRSRSNTAAACSAGDARNCPRAVWVCGCAASGKTEIGRSVVLPLDFVLIDTDQVFEELLWRHRLSFQIPAPTAEEQERVRRGAAARRIAQRLAGEQGESVDPRRLVDRLAAAVGEGSLEREDAELLAAAVRTKVGTRAVSQESFQRAIWPKMTDWTDPLDYLEDKQPLTQDHLYAVAREITRRSLVAGREEGKGLLIVETGGQTGKTLNTRNLLELVGYETFLVWVGLRSLDDALRRNRARGVAGGRCLPAEIVQRSFTVACKAREKLIAAFQPSVLAIDNSADGEAPLGDRIREVRAAIDAWLSP